MENLFGKINRHSLSAFRQYLAMRGASHRSIKRKESSLRHFFSWAVEKGYLKRSPYVKDTPLRLHKFSIFHFPFSIRSYRALPYFTYINFLILLIFGAALGFGIYQQFILKAPEKLAYPAAPVTPNRYLSFQGRLTDSSNTPIVTATNMRFRLYDASSGGNTLWDSATCSIDPDEDGIFNTILGTTTDCPSAPAIASSVFSENASIWLGITVGSDPEATPRIQIATVGYALNAETLQGFPLASATNAEPTATMGATVRTVPAINPAGNLIIASASPKIWSTSGTFQIRGQALSIVTDTGTGGNITIAPDGSGVLNLTLSGGTGNVINATDANLGSSGGKEANTLLYGSVANNNTNLNLLKLESGSSPTPKFTVDYAGNASAAGYLRANTTGSYFTGDITVSGGDITGTGSVGLDIGEISSSYITSSVGFAVGGGTTYYINSSGTGNLNALTLAGNLTLNANVASNIIPSTTSTYDLGSSSLYWNNLYVNNIYGGSSGTSGYWTKTTGLIYPNNTYESVAVGGTATSSAKLYFEGTTGNASMSGTLTLGQGQTIRPAYGPLQLAYKSGADAWTTGMVINESGNVGIGTTGPAGPLHVKNTAGDSDVIRLDTTGTGVDQPVDIRLGSTNAKGIRVVSVTGTLTVQPEGAGFQFYNNTSANFPGQVYFDSGAHNSAAIIFRTAPASTNITERMRITSSGNVGIGDTTPDGKLDVEATGAVTTSTYGINLSNLVTNTTTDAINKYGAYITSTGTFTGGAGTATNNWGLYVDTVSGADNNYGAYIAGNVGIGDTSPAALLTVGSGDLFQVNSSGAIAAVVGITNTGTITSTGGIISLNASSNYAVNIATGTSTGAVTIGGDSNTVYINSSDWDIGTTGDMTGIGAITMDGNFSQTGATTFSTGTGLVSINGNLATSLIPNSTSYNLGSSSNYWGSLYVNNIYAPGTGVSGYWQRNLGTLSPTNITDDILVGGTATSSALVRLPGINNQNAWFNLGTGNVGIGTTNPARLLHLSSSSTVVEYLQEALGLPADQRRFNIVTDSSNTASTYFRVLNDAGTGGTGLMTFVHSTGNVGIGDVSPLSLLTVGSGDKFQVGTSGNLTINTGTSATVITAERSANGYVIETNVGGTPGVDIGTEAGVGHAVIAFKNTDILVGKNGTSGIAFGSGVTWSDVPAGATDINIKGNVGIGTTSPSYKLHAVGDGYFTTNLSVGGTTPSYITLDGNDMYVAGQFEAAGTAGQHLYKVGLGTNSIPTNAGDLSMSGDLTVSGTGTSTFAGDVDIASQLALGSGAAITSNQALRLVESYTADAATYGIVNSITNTATLTADRSRYGIYNTLYAQDTEDPVNGWDSFNYGVYSIAQNQVGYTANRLWGVYGIGNNVATAGTVDEVRGVYGLAQMNAAGGTVTTGYGVFGLASNAAGTMTTGYGGYFDVNDAAGTMTTGYGVYIGDVAATTQYGLYQAGATDTNYFAGNVGIGTTNPATFKLEVAGNIGPEATGTRDLGSTARVWNNIYANNYYQGSTALGLWLDAGTYIYPVNVGTGFQITDTGNLTVSGTASFNSAGVTIDSSNFVNAARFVDTAGSGAYFLDPAAAASLNIAGYATTAASLAVGYSSLPSGPGNAVFSGLVGIGTTGPAAGLDVRSTIDVSGTARGVDIKPSLDPGDWYNSWALLIQPTMVADAGETVDYARSLFLGTPSKSGTGTINEYSQIYIANPSGMGTATYALYSAGGINYFGGNVGIGDITPDGKLDVESTGAVTTSTYGINLSNLVTNTTTDAINKYGAYITSTGTFTGGAGTATNNWGLYVDTVSDADNNYGAYIAGSVGIGTTGPGAKLDVYETTGLGGTTGNSQLITRIRGFAGTSNVFMNNTWLYRDATGTTWATARLHNGISIDASFLTPGTDTKTWWERDPNHDIQSWGNAASTYMTINAGNVGIGTTNPGRLLHIASSNANPLLKIAGLSDAGTAEAMELLNTGTSVNTAIKITMANSSWVGAYLTSTLKNASTGASAFSLYTNTGGGSMKGIDIDSAGSVGIGTTSPGENLEISESGGYAQVWATGYGTQYAGIFVGRAARGTSSVPTASQVNDALAVFGGRGYGATGWASGSRAAIMLKAAEAWTDSAQGTYITFENTPTGSTARAADAYLDSTIFRPITDNDLDLGASSFRWKNFYAVSKAGFNVDIVINDGSEPLNQGDVVVLTSNPALGEKNEPIPTPKVKKADKTGDPKTVGVIYETMNPDSNGSSITPCEPGMKCSVVWDGSFMSVKADASFGAIEVGDLLTASENPGYARKVPKTGDGFYTIIGQALESLTSGTGKIKINVHLSWYDPDVYLTDTGDLQIAKSEALSTKSETNSNVSNLENSNLDIVSNLGFRISNLKTGEVIRRVGAFAEIAVAQLRAGLIQTQELFAEKKIVSPLVETEEIKKLSKIEIKGESGFGRLLIQNEQGETVASIDSSGSATFAGQVTSDTLQVTRDATVAGILYVDEIITKYGKFGDLLAERITTTTVSAPSPTPTPELTGLHPVTPEASESALLAEAQNWEISDVSSDLQITNDELRITDNLKVLGRTSLASTTVAGPLSQDGSLILDQGNSINVTTGTLYLQNFGFGGVDILAGKVVIDIDGNVQIAGGISASRLTLKDTEENTEIHESGFGKLLAVVNKEGNEVAYITKEGEGAFTKLAIIAGGEATASAEIGENEVQTNATAGKAVLKAGLSELTIHSSAITDQTLIYVTPISNTQNKVLYVSAKKVGEFFKVAIDTPINADIEFNYWLIN